MNDDPMDEQLIEGARDYNRPGAVPRDEMWAAIAAARHQRAAQGGTRRRMWVWPSVGVAAAVILSLGVAIGRRWDRTSAPPPAAAPTATAAKPVSPDSIVEQLHEETQKTDQAVRALASARGTEKRDTTLASPARSEPSLAYRLVVLRHLAGSEALITSFRTSAKQGEVDAQIGQWARELLGTTRLLEASQAAEDPVMHRLLEDLDLIIAQIAQYATRGKYDPEELDLIEQSINQRGVIAKLRSTMPASTNAARM